MLILLDIVISRHLSIDEEAEYLAEAVRQPASKLPDLIKEIVHQARGKDAKEGLVNNQDEAGMVKKRITLFENQFCKI